MHPPLVCPGLPLQVARLKRELQTDGQSAAAKAELQRQLDRLVGALDGADGWKAKGRAAVELADKRHKELIKISQDVAASTSQEGVGS